MTNGRGRPKKGVRGKEKRYSDADDEWSTSLAVAELASDEEEEAALAEQLEVLEALEASTFPAATGDAEDSTSPTCTGERGANTYRGAHGSGAGTDHSGSEDSDGRSDKGTEGEIDNDADGETVGVVEVDASEGRHPAVRRAKESAAETIASTLVVEEAQRFVEEGAQALSAARSIRYRERLREKTSKVQGSILKSLKKESASLPTAIKRKRGKPLTAEELRCVLHVHGALEKERQVCEIPWSEL